MMKRNSVWVIFCLLPVACCFYSCKYNTEYQTINASNQFSVSIPPWMKEDKTLKEGAPFQYANRYRNFYSVAEVYTGSLTKPDLNTIMANKLGVLRKSLADAVVTDSVDIGEGGNMRGVRVEIYGKMSGENIYFTEVLLEGKSHIYHLSIWTRGEDRKLRFKDDINRMIASFKEI